MDSDMMAEEHKVIRMLSEVMHDYIFRLQRSDDGTFVMSIVAGKYSEVTGRSQEEIKTPGDWHKTIHPDDLPVLQASLKKVLEEKVPVILECRSFTAAKEMRWLEVKAFPELDIPTQEVCSIYGNVRNISDLKQKEEGLRKSEQKSRQNAEQWKTMINLSPDGISIVNLEGRLLFVNENLVKWHGYIDASEMIGRNALDFAAVGERERLQAALSGVLSGKFL